MELSRLIAQGKFDVTQRIKESPEIAKAYELYSLCRSQTLIVVRVPKGKDEIQKMIPYTTGLAVLPYKGGVIDQPVRLMAFFEAFMSGDHQAFSITVNS